MAALLRLARGGRRQPADSDRRLTLPQHKFGGSSVWRQRDFVEEFEAGLAEDEAGEGVEESNAE